MSKTKVAEPKVDSLVTKLAAPVLETLEAHPAPAGWSYALRSKRVPVFDDAGNATGAETLVYQGGGGEDFRLEAAVFLATPVDDDAAAAFLRSQSGTEVVGPDGVAKQLNGLQSAAWQIVKHRAEAVRGRIRKDATENGINVTPAYAQAKLCGAGANGAAAEVTQDAITAAASGGPEAIARLLASLGHGVKGA